MIANLRNINPDMNFQVVGDKLRDYINSSADPDSTSLRVAFEVGQLAQRIGIMVRRRKPISYKVNTFTNEDARVVLEAVTLPEFVHFDEEYDCIFWEVPEEE